MKEKILLIRPDDFPEENLENLWTVTAVKTQDTEETGCKYIVSEFHYDRWRIHGARITSKELIVKSPTEGEIKEIRFTESKIPYEWGAIASVVCRGQEIGTLLAPNKDGWDYKEKDGSEYQTITKTPIWAQLLIEGKYQTMSSGVPEKWKLIKRNYKLISHYRPDKQEVEEIAPDVEIQCVMRDENQKIIYKKPSEAKLKADEELLVLFVNNSTQN